MKNVNRSNELPFIIETRKFNYPQWYRTHTDIHRQRTEPTLQYVAFIESWAKRTWLVPNIIKLRRTKKETIVYGFFSGFIYITLFQMFHIFTISLLNVYLGNNLRCLIIL
ncbi:hypothetical protein OGZ51_12680 [Lactococcus lactis]|uniref:Uncharacterized protein n=1 Tax=Lactococcus lactis TaxID=1358 RepID=A0A9X4NJ13_9LACT|nr:hypothetical protein [Lactococcus lactis]MDG4985000.1 hypothetical protein [Lactococcus lactis]